MWLAYDPQRFWAGVDPNITAKTLAATRAELHNIADGFGKIQNIFFESASVVLT